MSWRQVFYSVFCVSRKFSDTRTCPIQIGAGTGGTTACVLKALQSQQRERLYQSYTVTDISTGFLSQCRERFSNYSDLKYATLDISIDPIQQGFEAESFDLIVASNVMYPCIRASGTRVDPLSSLGLACDSESRRYFEEMPFSIEAQRLSFLTGTVLG